MTTEYATISEARADGWLTLGDVERFPIRESDDEEADVEYNIVPTLKNSSVVIVARVWRGMRTTPKAKIFENRMELRTSELRLNDSRNKLGHTPSYATAVRRDNLEQAMDALEEWAESLCEAV